MNIVLFIRLFYGVHFFKNYHHKQHVKRVIIIESYSGTTQDDPLRGPLFLLAHYRAFVKTIMWAPNYVFPSLTNNIHILGPTSKNTHTFDHLLTQLTLVGLKVKMSKCKLWTSSKIFPGIKIFQGCTLITNGLHILGVPMGFQDFATYFLDKVLF